MLEIYGAYNQHLRNAVGQLGESAAPPKKEGESTPGAVNFEEVIGEQISRLNESQVEGDNAIERFVAGEETDLHNVMITIEEARMSMELAVQVRNKMIEAYKELNNMQL